MDVQEKRVGFRRVRVVQDELEGQPGHSFLFEVNNVRIFCGGWLRSRIARPFLVVFLTSPFLL